MKFWKTFVLAVAAVASTLGAHAGTVTYYHNDLTGSPIAATNASGQLIWKERYRPFGERVINDAASSSNDMWFTSRRQDDTGLVYMGARYYDPVVGRFISTDPKIFDEQNPHLFNRYAYANNNPYRYVDPDGKQAVPMGFVVGAAVLVGTGIYVSNPDARKRMDDAAQAGMRRLINVFNEAKDSVAEPAKSPEINPTDVAGKTPQEIDQLAREKGLTAKGPDPARGRGSYVDPVTGEQRILVHPDGGGDAHAHVNDSQGRRLDTNGNNVRPESPEAHLPIQNP